MLGGFELSNGTLDNYGLPLEVNTYDIQPSLSCLELK